jgi:hypothetical protein
VQLADEAICIGGPQERRQLPARRPHHQRGRNRGRGCHPPGLWLSFGKRQIRRAVRVLQHQVHRPEVARHQDDGRQGHRQGHRAQSRRPDRAGLRMVRSTPKPRPSKSPARSATRSSSRPSPAAAARHAHRPQRRVLRQGIPCRPQRGGKGVRQRSVYIEKYIETPASHRISDPRRQPWQGAPSRRTRLLGPAPPPKTDRGEPLALSSPPRCAKRWARPP